MSDRDEFEQWLTLGIESGWISEVVCETHEGVPRTVPESLAQRDGRFFCVPAVRVIGLENVQ